MTAPRLALAASVLAGGLAIVVIAQALSGDNGGRAKLPAPDVPPLEYVYLDNARVLAYLGQVEQGLARTETRKLTERRASSAGVKGADVVEVSAEIERQRETEQVVSQTEADRFFTFLRIMRSNESHRRLFDMNAQLAGRKGFAELREKLGGLMEGDFIRIRGAQLSLPPFAAVFPGVRYVPHYRDGRLSEPQRPLFAPISDRERDDVKRYRSLLGPNPRLPFIVPTIERGAAAKAGDASVADVATFIVPVRYDGLTKESGLLAGTVTIVGKVVHKDPRLPSEVAKNDPVKPFYIDKQALASFGQALTGAPKTLLKDLEIPRGRVARAVTDALRIPAPVLLVVPLAIYQ